MEGDLGLGGHVVIGVVRLVVRFHQAYEIPSVESLLNFVVQLCICSQTVFCDRQFHLLPNSCTPFHREKGVI